MTAEERTEEATMKCPLGMKLVMGFLASSPISGFPQQTGIEQAVPITVVVHDRANVKPETLAVAKQLANRVLNVAGFAVTWINIQDDLNKDGSGTNSEQTGFLRSGYLSVVITSTAYPGSGLNEGGFAAVTAGPYRRAYVFLDRVEAFSEKVTNFRGEKIVGTVLGHVICHELGHLLMPNTPHPLFGIMRGDWDSKQWQEATQGLLLFSRGQAERMKSQIRDQCSASLARNKRAC